MKTKILLTISAVVFAAIPAQADWFPGDGHKMHFPQLPDPTGWDVDATTDFIYDDWQCSETGTVADVHFWMSWQGGNQAPLNGVALEIRSDVPAGGPAGYSHPGGVLWQSGWLDPTQYTVRLEGVGDQGWSSPTIGLWNPNDHLEFFQVNIPDIQNPFVQQKDSVYWLGIHLMPGAGQPQPMAGWKTSQDHFLDDAVWYDPSLPDPYNPTGPVGFWNELIEPNTMESLDMAFVITPEPGTAMLTLLGASLCLLRRRSR